MRCWAVMVAVLAGCVPAATPPRMQPPAAGGSDPDTHLTKAEIDAIPNAFPVTFVRPRTRALHSVLQNLTADGNPMGIGELVSVLLKLRRYEIPITVEECGESNAQYRLKTRSIHICYELIQYANELSGRTGTDRNQVDLDMRRLLIFTTLHEIGHALVHVLELPIEGNEEDLVDEFAFLALTNVNDVELARSVVAAPAQFLARHGEAVGNDRDSIHSAGGVRAFDAVCMLYGRLREPRAKRLLGKRAEGCIAHTESIRARWNQWLRPYTRLDTGDTF